MKLGYTVGDKFTEASSVGIRNVMRVEEKIDAKIAKLSSKFCFSSKFKILFKNRNSKI